VVCVIITKLSFLRYYDNHRKFTSVIRNLDSLISNMLRIVESLFLLHHGYNDFTSIEKIERTIFGSIFIVLTTEAKEARKRKAEKLSPE
jgi:hypothetical protein